MQQIIILVYLSHPQLPNFIIIFKLPRSPLSVNLLWIQCLRPVDWVRFIVRNNPDHHKAVYMQIWNLLLLRVSSRFDQFLFLWFLFYSSLPFKWSLSLYYCDNVTDVVVVAGNIVVLIVFARSKRMHTRTNLFLANLAVADFCVGVFCVLPTLSTFLSRVWILGQVSPKTE